jgi:hypothetical protein
VVAVQISPISRPLERQRRGRLPQRAAWCIAMAALGQALCGCGSSPPFQFDDLDLSPTQEAFTELSLGRYEIPVPIAKDRTSDHTKWHNRLQLAFELHALVAPEAASHLAGSWQRHEGKIRDGVIRVCRNASIADLQEPELATLKERLLDAVQDQLGKREVRRVLLTDIVSQKL